MRFFLIMMVVTALWGCSKEEQFRKVHADLQGKWHIDTARFNPLGWTRPVVLPHEYDNATIFFGNHDTFLLITKNGAQFRGYYRLQIEDRSNYKIHMQHMKNQTEPLRIEYWQISNGMGRKIRAVFETEEGFVVLNLLKPDL